MRDLRVRLLIALALLAMSRPAAAERPRVQVLARFEEVGLLRTRIESDLGAKSLPLTPEQHIASRAKAALQSRIQVYQFELAPQGGPSEALLVSLTRGGAMMREWPQEDVALQICFATPEPEPTCKRDPILLGRALEKGEYLQEYIVDIDFVGATLKQWIDGQTEEALYERHLRVPIPTRARVAGGQQIKTPLTYTALGVSRLQSIFAVDTGSQLVRFRACDRDLIGGRLTRDPRKQCGDTGIPQPADPPAPGKVFGEVFYLGKTP